MAQAVLDALSQRDVQEIASIDKLGASSPVLANRGGNDGVTVQLQPIECTNGLLKHTPVWAGNRLKHILKSPKQCT